MLARRDLPYASLFFAGILFYKVWTEGPTLRRGALLGLCYVTFIIGKPTLWAEVMAVVFAVFGLCVMGHGKWLACRPLVFLGTISYSLYLIHGSLGYRVQLLNHWLGLSPWPNLALTVVVSIGAATAVTFLVERPANRAIISRYRKRTAHRDDFATEGEATMKPTPIIRATRS